MPERPEPDLLHDVLKRVSRSFYLTLRALPGQIRPQIGLAYLLARTADTIADSARIPVESRLDSLRLYRDAIASSRSNPLRFEALAARQTDEAERILLLRASEGLELLSSLEVNDQALVKEVLSTITSGQVLDLLRFGTASEGQVLALREGTELDDYTYRVAGCVGDFWTKMCLSHLSPPYLGDREGLLENGVRFGKGLQLVNVLRDLPRDLAAGRCYLPAEDLKSAGLIPSDLLNLANARKLSPVFGTWRQCAMDHLEAGWNYTMALPRSWVRVRLACSWPVLIGLRTLNLLAGPPNLDAARRPKASKADVRSILLKTVLWYPFPSRWRDLFATLHK